MTEPDFRPPQQQRHARTQAKSGVPWWGVVLGLGAAAYGGWLAKDVWQDKTPTTATAVTVSTPQLIQPVPERAELLPLQVVEEAITSVAAAPSEPVQVVADTVSGSHDPLALDRLAQEWLGAPALQWLVMPRLARHIVATIDNLPRSHAPVQVWPLAPVGGQMLLDKQGDTTTIAPDNSARYAAVVTWITSIDPAQAAQWYRQASVLLQQAYENLGYPEQSFHDRLLAVIDHLLTTPQLKEPLEVTVVQVQGGQTLQQPWRHYAWAQPHLQALSAGQKILLRMGSAHQAQVMAYLQALRSHIAA